MSRKESTISRRELLLVRLPAESTSPEKNEKTNEILVINPHFTIDDRSYRLETTNEFPAFLEKCERASQRRHPIRNVIIDTGQNPQQSLNFFDRVSSNYLFPGVPRVSVDNTIKGRQSSFFAPIILGDQTRDGAAYLILNPEKIVKSFKSRNSYEQPGQIGEAINRETVDTLIWGLARTETFQESGTDPYDATDFCLNNYLLNDLPRYAGATIPTTEIAYNSLAKADNGISRRSFLSGAFLGSIFAIVGASLGPYFSPQPYQRLDRYSDSTFRSKYNAINQAILGQDLVSQASNPYPRLFSITQL